MNIRFTEGQPIDPMQERRNALAKTAAILAADAIAAADVADSVSYRSSGKTLIVGSAAQALPWADRLATVLPVTLVVTDGDAAQPAARGYPIFAARSVAAAGWLGAFEARWQDAGQAPQGGRFDLLLDLGASALIATHQHPHGYYAPGPDESARREAVDAMLEMVGEFEKPKYFAYKERLCAHSRNRQTGCSACIDICSARAIDSAGDRIKVNPYLCAGCGACTTVCPSGALGYAYPSAQHTGARIKAALRAYHEAGGLEPVILFHAAAEGAARLEAAAVPGRVIPIALHHTASTGIDVWLSALAYGASGITVLMTGAEAPQYVAALGGQMAVAQAVLDGLGYAGPHFQLLRALTLDELGVGLRHAPRGAIPGQPAGFNLALEKRNTLDYALDHLHRHAPQQPQQIALPPRSPFGAIAVDRKACSLCMSCVGACPASALMDSQNAPQLRFVEKNCIQCGLCAATCPEDAIELVPRLSFADTRNQAVVLNETEPFCCIRCNKPFGTVVMIENMLSKLSQHPAFAGNLDRMRMCGDCRVIDMMEPEQGTMVIEHKRV
jgi:ferredoxin